MKEEWRDIPGMYPYKVSSMGRIISGYTGKLISFNNCKGYDAVSFYVKGKRYYKTVHSVVALVFIGPRPRGYEVNHKDLNKRNNAAVNLEYVTSSENKRHAIKLHAGWVGELNGSARLTEAQVREIRALYVPWKYGSHKLAKQFGVTKAAIRCILAGKTWGHIR